MGRRRKEEIRDKGIQGSRKQIKPSPPPTLHPSISLCYLSLSSLCVSHVPLSSDLHVYKMEGFRSPSGEISCPRLSSCVQDIRTEGEFERHSSHCLSVSHLMSNIDASLYRRMFCGGCYYELDAVCREY